MAMDFCFCLAVTMKVLFFFERINVNNNEKAKRNCKKITVIEEKRITVLYICVPVLEEYFILLLLVHFFHKLLPL